ncbi:MAG TPA: hypothetical protein PK957_04885 [Candidatus Dojkabacteria bacterium]|nr:hypothetical protein [Candidatus Dojkabacteria bacterium]HQF36567.1 hypothetical protein [Candidatus Dojkabacteria bacterium]
MQRLIIEHEITRQEITKILKGDNYLDCLEYSIDKIASRIRRKLFVLGFAKDII